MAGTKIRFPKVDDDNAYALEVTGDSMQPLYRKGDILVVSPNTQARKGDRVVVRTVDGEVLAKILVKRTAKTVELASFNPNHANLVFPVVSYRLDRAHRLGEPVTETEPCRSPPSSSLLCLVSRCCCFLPGLGAAPSAGAEPEPSKASPQAEQTPPTASLATPQASAPAVAAPPSKAPMAIGEEKHLRLAREEAEVERNAKLAKQHAIEPVSPAKLHYRVKVRDGGTLEDSGVVIRLAEIEAREADGRCTDKNGKDWACGSAARVALTRFIRYRAVSCGLPDDEKQTDYVARCTVGGVDLSEWMVRQGWAKPKPDADQALADAAEAAKVAQLGIWRGNE